MIIILPHVLYGFKTVTLRGKHRPRAFKNRVLSKIFEPKREEGPGK